MPTPNTAYLEALKNPVVTWTNPVTNEDLKVINPDIDLNEFTFSFADSKATASTPRLKLHSVGSEDRAQDLQFLTSLYGNPTVMAKYATGKTKTAEETETRFNFLAQRWQDGNPYSAMMAYQDDKPVGMFTMGLSGKEGIAEFAAVTDPETWKQGLATEAALLLFSVPAQYKAAGFKVPAAQDGSYKAADLTTVYTAVKQDNESADDIMKAVLGEPTGTAELYDAPRNEYQSSVAELEQVVANTRLRNSM